MGAAEIETIAGRVNFGEIRIGVAGTVGGATGRGYRKDFLNQKQ